MTKRPRSDSLVAALEQLGDLLEEKADCIRRRRARLAPGR